MFHKAELQYIELRLVHICEIEAYAQAKNRDRGTTFVLGGGHKTPFLTNSL